MNVHTGGQRFADALYFRVHLVRYLHGVALRLAIDAQENRGLSVRGNHRVKRTNRPLYCRNIADAHRHAGGGCLDDRRANLLWIAHLSADQPEVELVVAFEKARRIDQVGTPDCF